MKKGLILLLLISFVAADTELGIVETVVLHTPTGDHWIDATIDTGADSSSIDRKLAESLGLSANDESLIITDARGKETRNTIDLHFSIADKDVFTTGTVAERSNLSTKILIGAKDLSGFVVVPDQTFMSVPDSDNQGRVKSVFTHLLNRDYIRLIMILPMLSAIIIFLRHIIGIETYGIFGPLVLAASIHETGIGYGAVVFTILLALGLIIKFCIKGLNLPLISELALIMFGLSAGTIMTTTIFSLSSYSLNKAVFPMIISSFLVERFSQQLEVHETKKAVMTLALTLGVSFLLALMINFLMRLGSLSLIILFSASMVATILLGNYIGLRLTEVFRFKLLGEK